MARRALITGITGQDGSYLSELLLDKGYEVFGIVRRLSAPNEWRIEHLRDRITLLQADLLDQLSLIKAVEQADPHEFYNLAAMSFVPSSWDQPMLTGEFNAQGVTRTLEAIRRVNPKIRFYQASSQRDVRHACARCRSPSSRRSIRAAPTACPRRSATTSRSTTARATTCSRCPASSSTTSRRVAGLEFVTRKVRDGVARIKLGLADHLALGNLDAKRDWGFAGDYVRAMWLMLQADEPDDFVVATGVTHSVKELVVEAASGTRA